MSAIKTSEEPSAASSAGQPGFTVYKFEQRTSIPSYLIAIVSGNLAGREIGPRSTVWCEPEMVDAAAWEFAVSFLIPVKGGMSIHVTQSVTQLGYRKIHRCWRGHLDIV